MESMLIYLPIVMALIGLLYMMVKQSWILKQDAGDGKMKEISNHIYEGALAFLNAEYRLLTLFVVTVSVLLFVSISIAIRFSSRFFRSINNLILASASIGQGNFNAKVPEVNTDKDLETLNKNFNLMIDRLKSQQEKLIINERHEAWGSLARKLAHEIKNPLTPIQLTIDNLNSKYLPDLKDEKKIK